MGARVQKGEQGRANGRSNGFTIIETLLFLGISGLLAVLLLGGWTTMINTQRYKDSNRTLQSFLQQQYNLVYNVENGRSQDLSCTLQGTTLVIDDTSPATKTTRGQSPCVVMGRFVQIEDGTNIKVDSIVGYLPGTDDSNSDIASIKLYHPQRVDFDLGLTDNVLEIPWQATIVGTGDSNPKNYAIAIIRAPQTGIVHTFIIDTGGQPIDVIDTVDTQYESSDVNLCLDPGGPLAGGRQGISITAYASSQSSVRSITDAEAVCVDGGGDGPIR